MEWHIDSSMLLSVLLVSFITAALLVVRKRTCKLPPGPRGLPIIGHLHLLGKLPLHQSLCELSKIHGPLMSLRLGSVPVIVASSPETARQILQTHDLAFSNRMPTAAATHIYGAACMDVVFSQPNAHWKLMRRLYATELVSSKGLRFFKPVRTEEVRRLMRWVLADSSQDAAATPILQQMRPKLKGVTNDIITRMMVGKRFSELAGGGQGDHVLQGKANIVQLIEQFMDSLGTVNVGDLLPCIAWMDLQGCGRRSKRIAADLRAAFEGIIRARRLAYKDGHPPNDYLDILLQASASSNTPTNIMEVLLDFFVGGTDTSSLTLEWALAELIVNPEKMRIAQTEIDEVVGRARMIEEEDIDHLPFLVACVKETMRLHPAGPLLVPHKTDQACDILGFQIHANTLAYVNVWAIGRDPKVWENPTMFCPERFIESSHNVDVQGQNFELLPFGSGRRMCPGMKLGLRAIHIVLGSLLQGFAWSIPPSHHLDMCETFHTSLSLATPLAAYSTSRLPKELY